eukprot:TRINITY_DN56834_c0_g1_i1.p1 TRINITY_DN56834_c0_g1~~TRINITY_DN56834_c0_g1_i1.p1  ORF type:complete len:509 (+),score=83.56 TRINITY_DN56834_c0_g1_i1:99-1625(+)
MVIKECITISLGQAGVQVGERVWEQFCSEHEISGEGRRDADGDGVWDAKTDEDGAFESFFYETQAGQFVPRAIFADTDPRSKERIIGHGHSLSKLFHPNNVLACCKQDAKNNFFEGVSMAKDFCVVDLIMDRIRMEVDKCENLQGFFVFHALGGGTGSGVGFKMLEDIRNEFPKNLIFQPAIYPSRTKSSCVVEPYNTIFALHHTKYLVDLTMMLDNEKAFKICRGLGVAEPTFLHVNRLLGRFVSTVTSSLRFDSDLNATLPEIVTNLVPLPNFRYPLLSLAPLRPASSSDHEHTTVSELITDLFEEKNTLCDLGGAQVLRANRYIAACVLLRGKNRSDDPTLGDVPIPHNECMSALRNMVKPSSSHRTSIKFIPPMAEKGGFKVGIVGQLPCHVKPEFRVTNQFGEKETPLMGTCHKQGAAISNTTAVRVLFVRQYEKYLKLFFHKAYLWQFIEANGEMDTFYEARESIRDMIDNYENLMHECVRGENEKFPDARVQLTNTTNRPT